MQLRRALPLTLAALVMATGCVTVHPAAPPDAPHWAPAAARALPRQPTVPAWPLGPLPTAEPASPTPPDPSPPEPARPEPARPEPAPPEPDPVPAPVSVPRRPATTADQPHQPHRPRRAKPASPAKPAKRATPAKPRKRRPAPAKPRPAPQRTFDMTPLCEAARGTVSPSIVALCR